MDTIKISKCGYINSDMIFQGESIPDISGKKILVLEAMDKTVSIDGIHYKVECFEEVWETIVDRHFKCLVKNSLENPDITAVISNVGFVISFDGIRAEGNLSKDQKRRFPDNQFVTTSKAHSIYVTDKQELVIMTNNSKYLVQCEDSEKNRIINEFNELNAMHSGAHQKIQPTQFPDYRLFIDDERWPAMTDWVIARTPRQAIEAVEHYGIPKKISFDYDLGTTNNGVKLTVIEFIDWLENNLESGRLEIPEDFEYCVISNNEDGVKEINARMVSILSFY